VTPLVLLHGWALNHRVFDDLIERLARPCIALDLPGHGQAQTIDGWTPEELARHMLAQMPRSFDLLGWSLGAQVALQIAALAPERVRKLILVGATPKFVRSIDWPHAVTSDILEILVKQLSRDTARTISDFLALQVRGSSDAKDVLLRLQQALHEGGAASIETLHIGLEWLKSTDQRSLLPTIQQQTLVVAGQYDRVVHPEASKALAAQLGNALYLEIPRCGHAPFISHPSELQTLLQEFVS
jgi:pimeloyl-[acyl-carrier protein] methyl ester esterase